MMLLRSEKFRMTAIQRKAVEEVSRFSTFLYAVVWFRALFAMDSAPLFLNLWKDLGIYAG
jgi:hypothetical protein